MALFIKNKNWHDVDEMYKYLQGEYQWCDANKEIVKKVVRINKDF